jgi:SAM-dependent methyltransferase
MRPRADTLLVWTGAPCSYGCDTCPIDPATAPAGSQVGELQRALTDTPGRPGRLAVLIGGDPFLRPDFVRLLAAIRAAQWVPGIVTTGRPLLYPSVRERLRRFGVAYLRIQLFGFGDAHDRTTGIPGAFAQALAGLHAWTEESGAACAVDVALSTRGRSIEAVVQEIEPLAQALHAPGIQIVIAVDPAAPDGLEGSPALQRAVAKFAHWNDDASHPLLAWEGLPAQVSSGCDLSIDPLRPAFAGNTPHACCLGAVARLAPARLAAEETRANSFNFIRSACSVPYAASAEACTAHAAATDVDPHRHLWLVEDDRLVRYDTDTGDFPPAEIVRVKDEWSHLFVDRAAAGVLDDFTEGMRRVLPDPTCDRCANRIRCGRRFQVIEGAPFAREEAWIASYVAGLRGRVLDVGCGEQLYRAELAPLLRSGAVDYTGLDPDEISLTRARAALPEGRFYRGGIEEFRGAPASFDRILCLRSLNHVADLDEGLARMAELLKPGGQLLLVETTPFAMLRRAEQVAAADRAPRAGHQHFRNLASVDVLPTARRHSLRAVEHQPASLHATNEWILLLARAAT